MKLLQTLTVTGALFASLSSGFSIWEQLALLSDISPQQTLLTESEQSIFPEKYHPLVQLHKQIATIPSVSGNEAAVIKYLDEYLLSAGFNTFVQPIPNTDRSNIYAYKGDSLSAKVLLTSHVDTVPGDFPYIAKAEGIIYGRGVNDAKGSVASQIIAAEELYRSKEIQEGDLALLFVVGEENSGIGMNYASSGPQFQTAEWEYAVFGEPTELTLGVGHKGGYGFKLTVKGKASHSGYPELGIDANLKLIDIIGKLRAIEFEEDELLGLTTVNFGLINGGLAANIVSPEAEVAVVARVATNAADVRKKFLEVIEAERLNFAGSIIVEDRVGKDPVYLSYDIPGFDTSVLKYGTDVSSLKKDSIKSVYLFGPGSISNAHSPEEHIYVSDLASAVNGYKDIARWLLANKY
ncbi:hypothetical protein WICPIJ_007829 [Wickerhamomyces pijperi]|uniref:Peptidase M20 dimerisation domain-containing protein n=1 Tax=Wickerhamomyces pijperi TaxID=599730 RepID=A0A9P8TK27_WICPI|nr:hypothetical protein WICPIJ_007829 [Wickerhamomyces pijperi]